MPFKPPAFIAETIRNNWGEAWVEASETDAAAIWDVMLERGRINRIPPQFYKDDISWEFVLSVARTDDEG